MASLLWEGFLESSNLYPQRPAIIVENQSYTYADLFDQAASIAATVQKYKSENAIDLISIFAYRTYTAFSGVLGALMAGNGYVPLNRTFPDSRTSYMLMSSRCSIMIVDKQSAKHLDNILENENSIELLLFPDLDDAEDIKIKWPELRVLCKSEFVNAGKWTKPENTNAKAIAYLLFTSGSTGKPKGVAVNHSNVTSFLDFMQERYSVCCDDKLSQMFDMTFDLSVFDMFMTWNSGACLCCPSQKTLINPGKFINKMKLTIWFSVPSTAIIMNKFGMLKNGKYPTLRLSLFCGEPLPVSSVKKWALAAPDSIIENLYGPTELTIACTLYKWQKEKSIPFCVNDVVPIGYPYPEMETLIVNEKLEEVEENEDGELLMSGPQLTSGYWKDQEKTAKAYIVPQGKNKIFYRTGDRVRKPVGDNPMIHLGRIDNQVKIRGHRVELGEIDAVTRRASGFDGVVSIAAKNISENTIDIITFIEGAKIDYKEIKKKISHLLPEYMIPSEFHTLEKIPLNVNGKFDRQKLYERIGGKYGRCND